MASICNPCARNPSIHRIGTSREKQASRRIASILFSEPPKGSFEEAQYFFEKSLQYNPDYIGTYYWLGKTYLKLDKKQKAVELFQVGVTLDRPFKREEKAYQGMKRYLEKL